MSHSHAEPVVSIIMGSRSDWPVMEHAAQTLQALGIPHEVRVLSAHRTPDALFEYVRGLDARGFSAIIAAAGGAAHLPGVIASATLMPVIGVPMTSGLNGLDSLLSIVQMPGGIPVATMAIGKAGAVNAALYAAAILGVSHPKFREAVRQFRERQAEAILAEPSPA